MLILAKKIIFSDEAQFDIGEYVNKQNYRIWGTENLLYTLEQRLEILRHYFENHGNVAECVRKLRTDFRRRETPLAPYVRYLKKKMKETGILIDKPKREKPKTKLTTENIAALAESVCGEAPSTSIHRRSQQLNISETSLKRILHKDPGIQCGFASLSVPAIDLQKMPILAKIKSSFQMKLI